MVTPLKVGFFPGTSCSTFESNWWIVVIPRPGAESSCVKKAEHPEELRRPGNGDVGKGSCGQCHYEHAL